jgi:S1-C subfamily serine protease
MPVRNSSLLLSGLVVLAFSCDAGPAAKAPDAAPQAARAPQAAKAAPDTKAPTKTRQAPKSELNQQLGRGAQEVIKTSSRQRPDDAQLATADEANTISVFDRAAPATVFVTQSKRVVDRWSMRAQEVPAGTGSGFIWDEQGHVVTNFHVVDGANSLSVTLLGGKTVPARFIGGDPSKDLAVLKIEAPKGEKLTALPRPPKNYALQVGQKTLAIGNPFGLDPTLTTGVVSALGRQVKGFGGVTIRDMIQTDATINPGNSGGPLLNSAGELIGVNTMIYSSTGSSAGIGFAVPVSTVNRIVPQLIAHGVPLRVGLGVSIVPDNITQANGLRGVVVDRVPPGSAAAKAGLRGLVHSRQGTRLGDIILGVDGKKVQNFDDLFTALDARAPGDQVLLSIQRGEALLELKLPLQTLSGR